MSHKDIRCGCPNAKAYCSRHSKLKMVVQLKDEYKTNTKNPVYYSFFKEESKPPLTIIKNMLKRLATLYDRSYNCIDFYDTTTNQLIHREV